MILAEFYRSEIPTFHFAAGRELATMSKTTSLDLDSLGLVGTIAPHIGNLPFLSALYFTGNSFQGKSPKKLAISFGLEH